MPRLVSTGSVIVDLVLGVDALPEPGGDILAASSIVTAGGGLNALVAARRDGLEVLHGGRIGTGPFATMAADALAAAGIPSALEPVADLDSGYCVVLVGADAERTFVTATGAEGRLDADDLDRLDIDPDDLVLVSGYSLAREPTGEALAAWLERLPASVRVLLDPSPVVGSLAPALVQRVMARTSVLTANAREASILTGEAHARAAAGALGEGVAAALVRVGPDGCWVAASGAAPHLVPGFAVDAVDSTGAGDAHTGVLAAALARGDDLATAVRRANAAAALTVTRRGPATSPTAHEIDGLLSHSKG